MNMNKLISQIRLWGEQRYITGPEGRATPDTQYEKLMEEVDEIRQALQAGDKNAAIDGIGDTVVVLTLLADLVGTTLEDCVQVAYDEIKDRTGKMVDGQFVKDKTP